MIDWCIKKLTHIMFNFQERIFPTMIQDCYKICMVAKAMIDKKFVFVSHTVLGCLYLNMGLLEDARKVFDLLRDVAEEIQDWSQAMLAYEWIGRVLQASCDFDNAIKSFKKMMQLSWVNNIPEYEIKSFHNIAKQYFYLQYIEKSTFYQERFLRGMLENPLSCQRTIAE